jgi:hypothetical protein
MIPQTLAVTLLLGLISINRRTSGAGIGIMVASMLIWPEFLRIPLGLFEVSAPRLIALMLLVKAFSSGKHRLTPTTRVDRLVLAIWVWTILAALITSSTSSHITQMIGRGLDTVLMYYVVRMHVTCKDDLRECAKWLIYSAVIMGILGMVETSTTRTPYAGMDAFRSWAWIAKEDQFRYGFLRAKSSMSIHIYFGMAMMLMTGMLWSINRGVPLGRMGKIGIVFGVLGTMSSMSSGPWLGCALMFGFGLYRLKPRMIRPSIYLILVMALLLEIASNRHFYNLIDYLALDPHTAWYRTRLLEVAASHLSEFWIVGVGAQWPHHWGAILDGRGHVDVVNHFLIVALYGGLPAMFMYIATHSIAISYVKKQWQSDNNESLKLIGFNLACVLLALDFSSLSVGLFGPPLLLSHMLLALMVSVTHMRDSEVPPETDPYTIPPVFHRGLVIKHP